MDPRGKVAIVTGGNSGLGAGAAARLVADGAHVVSLDRGGAPVAGAEWLACDVADEDGVRDAVDKVAARHGRIHILLNNAGIGALGPIASTSGPGDIAGFRRVIETNLVGAVSVAAHVAHRMMHNPCDGPDEERGVIINTCSIASFEGQEGMGAYTAAKAALAALVLVWARDLSARHIRVNGIAPGFMATPMVAMLPEPLVEELLRDVEYPQRAGTAEDFAQAVDFIIRAPFINGEVIRLDGACRPPARTRFGTGQ